MVIEAMGASGAAYAYGGYFVIVDTLVRPPFVDSLVSEINGTR